MNSCELCGTLTPAEVCGPCRAQTCEGCGKPTKSPDFCDPCRRVRLRAQLDGKPVPPSWRTQQSKWATDAKQAARDVLVRRYPAEFEWITAEIEQALRNGHDDPGRAS